MWLINSYSLLATHIKWTTWSYWLDKITEHKLFYHWTAELESRCFVLIVYYCYYLFCGEFETKTNWWFSSSIKLSPLWKFSSIFKKESHYKSLVPICHYWHLNSLSADYYETNISCKFTLLRLFEHHHEKTCLMPYAKNKGADQPVYPRSLISTFVVRCLDSTYMPYLTLWDKISQNLGHLEANSHKIIKSHRIFIPSYNKFYEEINITLCCFYHKLLTYE